MPTFLSPYTLAENLQTQFTALTGPLSQAVLLDFPDHRNAGDFFIALGTLRFFQKQNISVLYASTAATFSQASLEATGDAPVFFSGGGNLGDLWPAHETLRCRVIAQNPGRRMIILPQSLYFTDPAKLAASAAIYNAHPDLTLCLREQASFEIAQRHFSRCKLALLPDMAFQLMPEIFRAGPAPEATGVLVLARHDQEKQRDLAAWAKLHGGTAADWDSFQAQNEPPPTGWDAGLRGLMPLPLPPGLAAPLLRQAWHFLASSRRQLTACRFLITDRLHGHILAVMLGVPHILLPNRYHKNASFYQTWTRRIPFCRLAKDTRRVAKQRAALEAAGFSTGRVPVRSWHARLRSFFTRLRGTPRVSFCIPCMGRLPHLEQTLLKNIEDNRSWRNTEFVLLNYGADPALDAWARSHLGRWIARGKIRYYKTDPYPFYHMAHAKNVAHKLATGQIVCNLDADNFTGPDFARFLAGILDGNKRRIAHGHWTIRRGTSGRIAMAKDWFLRAGGYEESLEGWGGDDMHLIERLQKAGFESHALAEPAFLNLIEHSDAERTQNFPPELRDGTQSLEANRQKLADALAAGTWVANAGKPWGRARVYPNFSARAIEMD